MKKLSQKRAWVKWQQQERRAGIESFEYLLGLIDRLKGALEEYADHSEFCGASDNPGFKEARELLKELKQ